MFFTSLLDMNGIEFIEDKDYFIIKRYGKYFRLGVPEANMLRELTVHRDVQTVLRKYGISEEDFSKFVHALEECGVIGDVKKERKNILFYRFKLINPDTYLHLLVNKFFSNKTVNRLLLIFSALIITMGLIVFLKNISQITDGFFRDFVFFDFITFYIATILVIFLYELGHGIACKYFGGKVEEIGFLLIFFSPALYCDVSGIWSFKDKKQKIITLIAGVYVQLIIFSLCSIIYDLYFGQSTWLATFILWNVLMIFFNILPFVKLDGYWILSNIVEIPNLYEKSLKLALGRGEEVLFDEREILKKKFIKVFGILNIVFVFMSIVVGFVGIYYVSINIGGYFQYVILFFEGITYFLVLIFFGLFLYKLSKQKSLS
ncbi:M50 family metallopeptidase [Geobacillus sp. C56-T3]|uniref:M50 family metallopeptidase n=1 Tax=Geobacillus sp. (strain C56-T3) TaxID=691437 RepID=UPI0001D589D1|nr:M50 family metallopeptidase [Geobacillus sp. C56-T3]ADI28152.1 peptidase M50 [Geobacillus sp. C56-T3]